MSREIQYDVFLSHSDADNAAVELIAQRLREEAGLAPFLDSWHLIPGRPWMDEVEKALAQSLTVAVFVGPSGISPWHNEEMRAALDEAVRTRDEVRVIPVLLPGATEASVSRFLARRVWVDFRPGLDDGEAFQRLVAGIKGEAIVGGVYELPDEPAPYRGLLRFEAEHTRFFFGREADRRRLVEKLEEDTFVAVVGASGSGKSSLVRAGLLPALARGALPGSDQWHTLVFQPGGQPLRTLAEQVATLVPIAHRLEAADDLTGRLSERADGLRTAATTYLADRPGSLLLVVDQFEELFTLCREKPEACRARVEQFIANLADAVENGEGRIRILITLRADFLDRCLAFPALRDLLQNRQVLLGPLDEAALREVIVRPAQEVGAFFEKGLVSMVLRDVEDKPGALPLLQHALYELWRARRGPWLTIDAYEASGGVEGALQRRAQATYESLTPEQQVIARNILLRLTALGEGIADTRRRVERDELYLVGVVREQVDAVLQALSGEKTRLVVAGEESVEVAHEALIQSWSTLRGWLEEDREELLIHRRLTQASEEWDEDEREESYLYHGARLAQAEEWAASHGGELNPLEQEFLEASVAARRARQMAARRRVRYTVAGLAIAVVILATLAFIAFQQWRRSDRNARALETSVAVSETSQAVAEAERNSAQGQASRLLAEQSLSQLDADYDLALLLAIASGRTAGTFEAEAALHEALFRRGRIWVLAGHDGPLKQMAWDGAGSRLATAGEDGTARIWDADSRQELAVLQGHRGSIEHIAWSPDYQRLVTAGVDGTARIWDADSGQELAVLRGHGSSLFYAAWNPAGTRLVTTSADGTARVWDVGLAIGSGGPGAELAVFREHQDPVYHAAWDHGGGRIVTSGDHLTAIVWDPEGGDALAVLRGHQHRVVQAEWSQDDGRIATASFDNTARIWDADSGAELAILQGHYGPVNHLSWGMEDRYIVTASEDGTARLWDVQVTPGGDAPPAIAEVAILRGHEGAVLGVAWNADDSRLVTAGADGTARVWDVSTAIRTGGIGAEMDVFSGHGDAIVQAAWNRAGTRLATASADHTARLWAEGAGVEVAVLGGHGGAVNDLAWDRTGGRIVTASGDGTARVWDAESGTKVALLSGHRGWVSAATWDRAGALITTASWDGTARVWDAESGVEVAELAGHSGWVNDIAWQEQGTYLATAGEDGTVRLWQAGDGIEVAVLAEHQDKVLALAWNGAGTRLATASADGTARVWNVAAVLGGEGGAAEVTVLAGHGGEVLALAWNGAGTRLATASTDGTARIWDVEGAAESLELSGHDGDVLRVAWDASGARLATAGEDGTVKVWDAAGGTLLATLEGHGGPVQSVAWHSDGRRIVTASLDGTARIWDAESGVEVAVLRGHEGPLSLAVWNPEGTRIATAGLDGTARVYYASLADLLEAGCWRAVRNMTPLEWKRYMGDEPYAAICPNLAIER